MTAQRFTGALQEIAEIAGEPAAVLVAAAVGGTRVYIPAKAHDGHWLVECVGREKADLICKHFAGARGGQSLDIPLAGGGAYSQLRRATAKRVHDLDAGGASAREIARQAGVTVRTVHKHRAAHQDRRDGRQGTLFGGPERSPRSGREDR